MQIGIEHAMMLSILAIIGCIGIAVVLIGILKKEIQYLRYIFKQNKAFKKKEKARQEMLARGEIHEWVRS